IPLPGPTRQGEAQHQLRQHLDEPRARRVRLRCDMEYAYDGVAGCDSPEPRWRRRGCAFWRPPSVVAHGHYPLGQPDLDDAEATVVAMAADELDESAVATGCTSSWRLPDGERRPRHRSVRCDPSNL